MVIKVDIFVFVFSLLLVEISVGCRVFNLWNVYWTVSIVICFLCLVFYLIFKEFYEIDIIIFMFFYW